MKNIYPDMMGMSEMPTFAGIPLVKKQVYLQRAYRRCLVGY